MSRRRLDGNIAILRNTVGVWMSALFVYIHFPNALDFSKLHKACDHQEVEVIVPKVIQSVGYRSLKLWSQIRRHVYRK